MSPGLAARTVFVCVLGALILMGGISHAERRPVAVVDMTGGDERARNLARDIRAELVQHAELQPVLDTSDETALAAPLVDEDALALADAQRAHRDAEAAFAQSKLGDAIGSTNTGRERLLLVSPPVTIALYAELTLTAAIALAMEHDTAAVGAFALVRKLAPQRTIDPAAYLPEVIDAFDAAKTLSGTGLIEVKGAGAIWLDGADTGFAAPKLLVDVPLGLHYVQLVSLERETRGMRITVKKDVKENVDIPDAPAPKDLQVRRARTVLAKAGDAIARASAMQQLARLVGVGDAVLILATNGKLRVQTWRDRAPGFTTEKDLGNQKTGDLLLPLAPPPVVIERPKPIPVVPLVEPERWYQNRQLQVSAGVAVVIGIVGAILWARSNVDFQAPNQHPSFPMTP